MNSNIDFLSSPFKADLISSNKDKKAIFGSFNGHIPIQFVASNTHFLFLNDSHQLYGFGSNRYHQISSKKNLLFALPVRVDLVDHAKIIEIACGENFSAILTDKQEIEVFGCQKSKIQQSNIRGLSASNKTIAFAYATNNVYVGTIENHSEKSKNHKKNEIKNTTYKLPAPILKTAINDFSIAALDQNGKVYICELGSDSFTLINDIQGISITSSHDSITILDNKTVHVYKCPTSRLTSYYLPSNFTPVLACSSFSDIFALSEDGRVSHCLTHEKELSTYSNHYKSIEKSNIDRLDSICAISMSGKSTIFLKGSPDQFLYEYIPKISPLQTGSVVKTATFEGEFICCTDKTVYFNGKTVSYSTLVSLLSAKHIDGSAYITAAQEAVLPTADKTVLDSLNLSIGATIKMKSKSIPIGAAQPRGDGRGLLEVVGASARCVWGRPLNSGFVVSLPSSAREFRALFDVESESLKKWTVDGALAAVSVECALVEELGYSPGDLVWHGEHGVVEVVGRLFDKLVLLEFCGRTLFSQEPVEMRMLRKIESPLKKSSKLGNEKKTRKVVDVNGEVMSLDITAGNGPRAFLPTDRVLSPLGEATVLGFLDGAYVQTDEMRMNGYEAVKVNTFDLKLIRRINSVAVRTINLSKSSSVKVSLNTEDSLNGLLPGDKVQVLDKLATVVGVTIGDDSPETVIRFKGSETCSLLGAQPFELVYRADINAVRKSLTLPPAFVGSPALLEAAFLPGDVVFNKAVGEAVFVGCSGNQAMLQLTKTDEVLTLGFSMLLTHGFFEAVERRVLDFWGGEDGDGEKKSE